MYSKWVFVLVFGSLVSILINIFPVNKLTSGSTANGWIMV